MAAKMYTYDEWNAKGYFVRKGEKAVFGKGKFLFSETQVESKSNKAVTAKKVTINTNVSEDRWEESFYDNLDADELRELGALDDSDIPF